MLSFHCSLLPWKTQGGSKIRPQRSQVTGGGSSTGSECGCVSPPGFVFRGDPLNDPCSSIPKIQEQAPFIGRFRAVQPHHLMASGQFLEKPGPGSRKRRILRMEEADLGNGEEAGAVRPSSQPCQQPQPIPAEVQRVPNPAGLNKSEL